MEQGESHVYVPCLDRSGFAPAGGTHYGMQARVQEETKYWFLTISQKPKMIWGGFVIANSLGSRAAEVGWEGLDYCGFI
jgi:hypothetical protein